jgi:hypothetical protein
LRGEKGNPDAKGGAMMAKKRIATIVVAGIALGALTSILQTYLNFPWLALVNAASPWLTLMFLSGALWKRRGSAAFAGLASGCVEIIGYYATSSIRGHSGSSAFILFWLLCALVGGPIFGVAGSEWWNGDDWKANLGASCLPAAFAAEAVETYALRLHYYSSAVLFGAISIFALFALGKHLSGIGRRLAWFILVFLAGLVCFSLTGLVYGHTF